MTRIKTLTATAAWRLLLWSQQRSIFGDAVGNGDLAEWPFARPGLLTSRCPPHPKRLAGLNLPKAKPYQQQVPSEHQLRPRAGEVVRAGAQRLVWRTSRSTSGILELDGRRNEYCAGYAVCYLRSERARDGLIMHLGSDDQAKVYLNGQLLLRCGEARSFAFDQNTIRDFSLQAGVNVLVLKLVNETGDWPRLDLDYGRAGTPG